MDVFQDSDNRQRQTVIMRHPIVYLFGPINSGTDAVSPQYDWRQIAKNELSPLATVYDPKSAISAEHAGQEVVEINEFVVNMSEILLGLWVPGSVGVCREVEMAIGKGKVVLAVAPENTNCKSPYYNDERIRFCADFSEAVETVKKLLTIPLTTTQ